MHIECGSATFKLVSYIKTAAKLWDVSEHLCFSNTFFTLTKKAAIDHNQRLNGGLPAHSRPIPASDSRSAPAEAQTYGAIMSNGRQIRGERIEFPLYDKIGEQRYAGLCCTNRVYRLLGSRFVINQT